MRCKPRAKSPKKIPKNTQKITKHSKKIKNRLSSRAKGRLKGRKPARLKSTTMEIGSAAFKALDKLWQDKLKADGFLDLEPRGDRDGLLSTRGAQPQALFKAAALDGRETYFRRLTNFVTHNPNWCNDKLAHAVAGLYIEGVSYRLMLPLIEARLKIRTNIWKVHKIVKALEARAKTWNKVHPEGLDFEADLSPPIKRLKA